MSGFGANLIMNINGIWGSNAAIPTTLRRQGRRLGGIVESYE